MGRHYAIARARPIGARRTPVTLHRRELWQENAQAMVDRLSLRKTAARIGVHMETAFRWRHRFLKMPKTSKPRKLDGTLDAD